MHSKLKRLQWRLHELYFNFCNITCCYETWNNYHRFLKCVRFVVFDQIYLNEINRPFFVGRIDHWIAFTWSIWKAVLESMTDNRFIKEIEEVIKLINLELPFSFDSMWIREFLINYSINLEIYLYLCLRQLYEPKRLYS